MQHNTSPLHKPCASNPDELNLRVRCTGSTTYRGTPLKSEYEIRVPKAGCSVQSLKELVRNVIGGSANGRYLRLISSGKMLAPVSSQNPFGYFISLRIFILKPVYSRVAL